MKIMRNNENNYFNVLVCPVPQYPCSHVAAGLRGEFRHIGGIGASCTLRQMAPNGAKWCIRCCLYEAMLSKIPVQLLHLKAIVCCPPPGGTLTLFDLLNGCKVTGRPIK